MLGIILVLIFYIIIKLIIGRGIKIKISKPLIMILIME